MVAAITASVSRPGRKPAGSGIGVGGVVPSVALKVRSKEAKFYVVVPVALIWAASS